MKYSSYKVVCDGQRMKTNASYINGRCLRVGRSSTSICRHLWVGGGSWVTWLGLPWSGTPWVSLLSTTWLQTEDRCKCQAHSDKLHIELIRLKRDW